MATTPALALPYPVGTDRVMDGDNVIQSLAERIEARMPRGWVAFAYTVTAGTDATAGDIAAVRLNVTTSAGRKYRLSGHFTFLPTVAATLDSYIKSSSAIICVDRVYIGSTATGGSVSPSVVFDGSAGAKVYDLSWACTAGAGHHVAAANDPTWLLLEDIGPAVIT